MKNRGIPTLLLFLVLTIIVTACSQRTAMVTPESTATLVLERCSRCHPLTRVESRSHTTTEWKAIVDQMITRGAQLTPEEESMVVDYLATNFGR